MTYGNDFNTCRDHCHRYHRGIDLIGARLQPIVAMVNGTIDHVIVNHRTAGNGIAVRGDDGWRYDVYHMNNDAPGTDNGDGGRAWRFAAGIADGMRVTAGQLIGWMGDSGNSEHSVVHAHVEIHSPGGQPINPYWSLRQAQRDHCRTASAGLPADMPLTFELWRALNDGAAPGWLLAPAGERGSARMAISPFGYVPLDAAAATAGDPRYDGRACAMVPPIDLDVFPGLFPVPGSNGVTLGDR